MPQKKPSRLLPPREHARSITGNQSSQKVSGQSKIPGRDVYARVRLVNSRHFLENSMNTGVRALIALVVTLYCLATAEAQGFSAKENPAKENDSWDLIIRNGRVIDGSGNPWFSADIGVRGDRIVFIGDLRE